LPTGQTANRKVSEKGYSGNHVADEYVIEVKTDDQPKLRIHCKTATPPDWAALLDAWRRME